MRTRIAAASTTALLLILAAPGALLRATPATVAPSALVPPGTGGAATVDRALAKLSQNRRLLVIGAHPDDEDSATLALVARAQGGEAAYLALSRGEGGQNLIGPELGTGLGVIRTHELLDARSVDGARQYFSRAFDFGYTRSLEETLRLWPRELLLEDAVRIIRRFRPQVVLSVFGNDGSGGHGQHQAAGHTAFDAFPLAGDPSFHPEQSAEGLVPWTPQALYRAAWFAPERATTSESLAGIDPWSGLSIAQIARLSRSQHRSQDMGRTLDLGGGDAHSTWVRGAGEGGHDLFAGVDISLASIAAGVPGATRHDAVAAALTRAGDAARLGRAQLIADDLAATAPTLATILADLDRAAAALDGCGDPGCVSAAALIGEKRSIAAQGFAAARSLVVDATTASDTLVPGETTDLTISLWNAGAAPVSLNGLEIETSFGAVAAPQGLPRAVAPGELATWTVPLAVPAGAQPTFPRYLARPLVGETYDWSDLPPAVRGEPFGPAAARVRFALDDGATRLSLERDAVERVGDPARGEIRRPLRVVPRLEVAVTPDLVVVPLDAKSQPGLEITLRSNAATALAGTLRLELACAGAPSDLGRFTLDAGAATTLHTQLPRCTDAGTETARVVARLDDGEEASLALPLIDHPHMPPTPVPQPATIKVVRAPLALPKLRAIAYVPGAADRVPAFLSALGLPVETLNGAALELADLARYDVVVIGSRAYEADNGLARANPRLLEWVRGGGTMIVQYQQYPFIQGGFAPLPMEIARPHDRITDETAPVRLLDPKAALFQRPNRIETVDWQGWVQERALYLPHSWDPGYTPLLEIQDPGQPPQQGALLVAHVGRGTWVYTGLAFFRQIPAGVPGAYRLFANLLALGGVTR